jgi:hypothetical protein
MEQPSNQPETLNQDPQFRIYLSGQITNLLIEEAYLNFEKAEKEAINLFSKCTIVVAPLTPKTHPIILKVINPMKLEHKENADWEDYMEKDISELLRCQGIYMLNNWKNSRGARIEYAIALELGLPIIYQLPML